MRAELDVVYCALDVLLDTRMGTAVDLDPDCVDRLVAAGYFTRKSDRYPGIDPDAWKERYQNRDKTILTKSLVSNGVVFVNMVLAQIKRDALKRPYTRGAKLVINLHPYSFDDDEQAVLKAVLEEWISPDIAPIEFITLSDESLTPDYCRQANIAVMIMYEYNPWLNAQTEAFKTMGGKILSDIILFAPMIYFMDEPTEAELREFGTDSPFQCTEMMTSPIIGLQLIDVEWFSLYNGKKK